MAMCGVGSGIIMRGVLIWNIVCITTITDASAFLVEYFITRTFRDFAKFPKWNQSRKLETE